MRHRWRRVHGRQHEIQFLSSPPLMPACLEGFSLSYPFPLLIRALLIPVSQQISPYTVPPYILDPEIVEIFKRTWYFHVQRHLTSAGVVGLPGSKIGEECLAAIGVEKLGRDEKSGGWGGWRHVDEGMALGRESGRRAFECTGTGWGWVDDSLKRLSKTYFGPHGFRSIGLTISP